MFETKKFRASDDTCVLCAGGMRSKEVWITPANAMLTWTKKEITSNDWECRIFFSAISWDVDRIIGGR